MKLAMAQMRMDQDMGKNLEKTVSLIGEAAAKGADFIFFPEVQLALCDVPLEEIRTVRSWKTWLALAKEVGPVY